VAVSVFALGRIEARFPSLAVEKEFVRAAYRLRVEDFGGPQVVQAVLADPTNRYLAREMGWALIVGGLEAYTLVPRDPADLDLLIGAGRPDPRPVNVDVVIGTRGPLAPSKRCNGLQLPTVTVDHAVPYPGAELAELAEGVLRSRAASSEEGDGFRTAAEAVLGRILLMPNNVGATDEHRAVNYLAVRCPALYAQTTECRRRHEELTAVEARPPRPYGDRKIVEVVFTFTGGAADARHDYSAWVDVTEKFPFVVSPLQPSRGAGW
jgi:hypothetical protein